MIFEKVILENFKKHKYLEIDFTAGTNMVVGPNYAGKSSVMEAMLIALLGNSAAPCPVQDLINDDAKDFSIRARFSTGHVVTRTSKNSTLQLAEEEPYARGHSAVNKAMLEILELSKDVFSKVFSSEQGSPQQLLEMEGAELQRFIETVIGIEELDAVLKSINAGANAARVSIKALEPMLLDEGKLTELQCRASDLTVKISDLDLSELQLAELMTQTQEALVATSKTYSEAKARNAAINDYLTKKSNIEEVLAHLGGLKPMQDVPSEGELLAAQASYDHATMMVAEIRANNLRWEAFHDRRTQLNDELGALDSVDEGELVALQGSLAEDSAAISSMLDTRADRDTLRRNLIPAQQELDKLVLPATTPTEVTKEQVDEAHDKWLTLHAGLAALQTSLKEAVCPTCKRPHDTTFDPEEAADRERELAMEVDDAYNTRLNVANDYHKFQGYQVALDKQKTLAAAVESLETQLSQFDPELDDKLDVLKSKVQADQTRLDNLKLTASKLAAVNARLSELLEPAGTPNTPIPFEDEKKWLDTLQSLKSAIATGNAYNKAACEHNAAVALHESKLAALVVPESLDLVDEQGIVTRISELNRELSGCIDAMEANGKVKLELSKELASIQPALDSHFKSAELLAEWSASYDNHSFIADLLTNSRAGFIKNAMATVFAVTTEFCKLSTGGDIEEVFFDGGIKYKEYGRVRAWKSGSGAQKSLFGLGMKLGIANLITTKWGCLLLDEAGAAMSDEISMQASLAMSTMCDQSVSITHRKLDIAGNMIALG